MARMTSRPRLPQFTDETLALFAELENTPPPRHWQKKQEFTRKSQRLASLLNLTTEWWACQRVEHDDPFRPHEGLAAHDYWFTVQRVRRQLLEALRTREARPAEEAAEHPVSEAP
jgi:hypothetical protein